jgi:hypothetical protein
MLCFSCIEDGPSALNESCGTFLRVGGVRVSPADRAFLTAAAQVTTVFAADAVSRMSGVPGVAIVTAGPGELRLGRGARGSLDESRRSN